VTVAMPDDERGKNIAKDLAEGKDPNEDLEKPEPGETPKRAEAALALRMSGASYTDIAKHLGYSSAYRARTAVERILAETANSPEERDQQRVLHDRRLNRLLQSVMGKATNPKEQDHLAYNARALAILDRIGKLHGVDAPTESIVYTPSAEKIEALIAKTLTVAQVSLDNDEADIIDADVVEEDDEGDFDA
jgi:predicted transcriptional regulator